jgi:hypothetical protein
MPKVKGGAASSSGTDTSLVRRDIAEFLEKRHLDVPTALRKACPPVAPPGQQRAEKPEESAEFKWALALLTGLKERERRALIRFVQKRCAAGGDGGNGPGASSTAPAASCSDGEDDGSGEERPPAVNGGAWPADVTYTNNYAWNDDVPASLRGIYQPAAYRQRAARPSARAFAAIVTDSNHPACGECGLYARIPLVHGMWVLDYVGSVDLGANEDRTSDYVCDFGEVRSAF